MKEVKVGIYARVSTTKEQNPETQLIELRKYCQDRGWPYTEYVDPGSSGATMDRPALNRLQKDIHYHRINCLGTLVPKGTRDVPDLAIKGTRQAGFTIKPPHEEIHKEFTVNPAQDVPTCLTLGTNAPENHGEVVPTYPTEPCRCGSDEFWPGPDGWLCCRCHPRPGDD